jgi:SAM-dependent methyltransferase
MGGCLEESSELTPHEWHSRYLLQSGWTAEIRKYLYQRASIKDARTVLEVGCGSGVICADLHEHGQAEMLGLDIDLPMLRLAKEMDLQTNYVNADALILPLPSHTFDLVICHYFLLWVSDPVAALKEMARVSGAGGSILALAEPDYGGRIDHPDELVELGKLQADGLKRQGADPLSGRKLSSWFHQAGLEDVECGVLGGQWKNAPSDLSRASEWRILKHDLERLVTPEELEYFHEREELAWQEGNRVLYIPTFYALGRPG